MLSLPTNLSLMWSLLLPLTTFSFLTYATHSVLLSVPWRLQAILISGTLNLLFLLLKCSSDGSLGDWILDTAVSFPMVPPQGGISWPANLKGISRYPVIPHQVTLFNFFLLLTAICWTKWSSVFTYLFCIFSHQNIGSLTAGTVSVLLFVIPLW